MLLWRQVQAVTMLVFDTIKLITQVGPTRLAIPKLLDVMEDYCQLLFLSSIVQQAGIAVTGKIKTSLCLDRLS